MKKIMLIPVIAVSLLTGCDYPKVVNINDWLAILDEDTTDGRYSVMQDDGKYDASNYDYELYTANLIKENVKDAKIKKKNVKNVENGYQVFYHAKNPYKDFTELDVYVYEDRIATTLTAYYTYKNPDVQRVIYEVPEENIKAIIDGAAQRLQYVRETNEKDYEAAQEYASIENFFKKVDEENPKAVIVRKKYYGVVNGKEDWRDYTVDYSNMADIKDLEYTPKENYRYNSDQTPAIVVSIGDELILRIFNWASGPIADMQYRYYLTYDVYDHQGLTIHLGYSLNKEKTQALIDKIQPEE